MTCAMPGTTARPGTSKTVDSNGNIGQYASLALDDLDQVHISYSDDSNSDLKYALAPACPLRRYTYWANTVSVGSPRAIQPHTIRRRPRNPALNLGQQRDGPHRGLSWTVPATTP